MDDSLIPTARYLVLILRTYEKSCLCRPLEVIGPFFYLLSVHFTPFSFALCSPSNPQTAKVKRQHSLLSWSTTTTTRNIFRRVPPINARISLGEELQMVVRTWYHVRILKRKLRRLQEDVVDTSDDW